MPEWSEEEVEQLLEMETRELRMLDGSLLPFTNTQTFWNSYDFVLQRKEVSTRRLIRLALKEREIRQLPFELTFPHVVSEHFITANEKLEARIKEIDDALLAARIGFTRAFKRAATI